MNPQSLHITKSPQTRKMQKYTKTLISTSNVKLNTEPEGENQKSNFLLLKYAEIFSLFSNFNESIKHDQIK